MSDDRVIMVNIVAVDRQHIHRRPTGEPSIDTNTKRAYLCLATPTDDGGWLLETWREGRPGDRQAAAIVADTNDLAAAVANAVQMIVDSAE